MSKCKASGLRGKGDELCCAKCVERGRKMARPLAAKYQLWSLALHQYANIVVNAGMLPMKASRVFKPAREE
ncbi:MAG: hypothetical protein K0U93_02635 [Gammaproteobacteria bacterium]|nr:hypothetical protein [Gammaproteobacteria bacterium]